MRETNTRRSFLAKSALAGAALQPLAAFGQAVQNTNTASGPSALRITDLKCGYVRGSLFVKIHTNQGIWGCGEAVDAVGGTYLHGSEPWPATPKPESSERQCPG